MKRLISWFLSLRSFLGRESSRLWIVLLLAPGPWTTPIAEMLDESGRLALAKRWAASDSLATRALERIESEAPGDTVARATALYHLARARFEQGFFDDTLVIAAAEECVLLRQRVLPPDDLDLASAHQFLGRIFNDNKKFDLALASEQAALEIRRARLAPTDTLMAESWFEIARTCISKQDIRSAVEPLEKALRIRQGAYGSSHPKIAEALTWSGNLHRLSREFETGRSELERSIRMYEETLGEDCRELISPLSLLGRLEADCGNLARSVDLSRSAVNLSMRYFGSTLRTAVYRDNLGDRLLQLGDAEGSREQLELALPIYLSHYGPDSYGVTKLRLKIALAGIETGDTLQAFELLQAIRPVLEKPGIDTDGMLSYCLESEAIVLVSRNDPQGALKLVRHGLEIEQARSKPRSFAQTALLRQQARIALYLGDRPLLEETRGELSSCLERLEPEKLPQRCDLLVYRALINERLGFHAEAREDALAGDRASRAAALSNVYALSDRQALLFAEYLSVALDAVIELATDNESAVRGALERVVLWRGMVRSALTVDRPSAIALADTAVVSARAQWIEAQGRLAQAVVQGGRGDSAAENISALRSAAEAAEMRYAAAAGSRIPIALASEALFDSIQARLGPERALVSMVEVHPLTDSARVVGFVARGRDAAVTRFDLGPSRKLASTVRVWLDVAGRSPAGPGDGERRSEEECRRAGALVRKLTWDPMTRQLGDVEDLYIVSAGPLLGLPWHALPAAPEGYLVEHGPLIHVLNAERELLDSPSSPGPGVLLAVGGVDFDGRAGDEEAAPGLLSASLRSVLDGCDPPRPLAFSALPATRLEAETIAEAWAAGGGRSSVTLLVGAAATEADFKRAAAGRTVIHLATHGVVWGRDCASLADGARGVGGVEPLDSGAPAPPAKAGSETGAFGTKRDGQGGRRVWLALAGANRARSHRDENEGLLTAEEVLTLDLRATEWVVLSACHSGMGEGWSREGLLGMRRAFHLAGARTVIASQWAVEDESTREWMQALYAARASGVLSATQATRRASLAILEARRRSGRSTHPFYWAGFVATGE